MDTNNFFSFSRIAMVMKREIMENWKTNLYRLIGIYAAFALVMILHPISRPLQKARGYPPDELHSRKRVAALFLCGLVHP